MTYDIPIGSGFMLSVDAGRVDALCMILRENSARRSPFGQHITILNTQGTTRRRRYRTNTSGVTGINWHKRTNSWHVIISIAGKNTHVGYFKDKSTAVEARLAAERRLSSGIV